MIKSYLDIPEFERSLEDSLSQLDRSSNYKKVYVKLVKEQINLMYLQRFRDSKTKVEDAKELKSKSDLYAEYKLFQIKEREIIINTRKSLNKYYILHSLTPDYFVPIHLNRIVEDIIHNNLDKKYHIIFQSNFESNKEVEDQFAQMYEWEYEEIKESCLCSAFLKYNLGKWDKPLIGGWYEYRTSFFEGFKRSRIKTEYLQSIYPITVLNPKDSNNWNDLDFRLSRITPYHRVLENLFYFLRQIFCNIKESEIRKRLINNFLQILNIQRVTYSLGFDGRYSNDIEDLTQIKNDLYKEVLLDLKGVEIKYMSYSTDSGLFHEINIINEDNFTGMRDMTTAENFLGIKEVTSKIEETMHDDVEYYELSDYIVK